MGWISIDPAALRRLKREIERDDESVVDELGVGAIHTGYADHFFPGTSVQQRRARYFFFTAWNLLELARTGVPSERLRARKEKLESRVTARLIDHHKVREGHGIIGGRIYPQAPAQALDFIHWNGLRLWGMYMGVSRSTLLARWNARLVRHRGDTRGAREEGLEPELLAVFDVPSAPTDWSGAGPLSFEMTGAEARFLNLKWADMTPCLLSGLARLPESQRRGKYSSELWNDALVRDAAMALDGTARVGHVPGRLSSFSEALETARRASALAELVRVTYTVLVWQLARNDGCEVAPRKDPAGLLARYLEDRSETIALATELSLPTLQRDVPAVARTRCLLAVLNVVQSAWRKKRTASAFLSDKPLRGQLESAEIHRKGACRARLSLEAHALREHYLTGTSTLSGLDYRWANVRRMLQDVDEGLRAH